MVPAEAPIIVASQWLVRFSSALYATDAKGVVETFHSTAWFRDVLTFSWDNRTLEGRERILMYLAHKLQSVTISDVKLSEDPFFRPLYVSAGSTQGIEFGYTYSTPIAHGKGFAHLLEDSDGEWKAHIVSMIIMDLKGHEEPVGRYNIESIIGQQTWGEYAARKRERIESDPYVVIIGAGQIGLQVAARFKQMDISCVVIERNGRVGDNWRKRYASLALHTVKEQHQLLYQPHPSNWPVYPPRDRVANMLETYAVTQELLVWTHSSPVGRPVYDHTQKRWHITVERDGTKVDLQPAHIVLATGTLGAPHMPQLTNRYLFPGTVIHASEFRDPAPFAGKAVVVVGAGNTSADICQDLAQGGVASVTMLQRSPVCVTERDEENVRISQAFSPDAPIEVSDFKIAAIPRGYIVKLVTKTEAMAQYWERHNTALDKVRKGGFFPSTEKPQIVLWLERMGGYWLDKGQADLIASGEIKVRYGVEPKAFSAKGMILTDESELYCDVVIFATGYTNIRETNRELFGSQVIDKTRQVWGMDSEGEIRGSYRPSGHPGLWYDAGDFYNGRFQSKHLAIQIKATELGLIEQS